LVLSVSDTSGKSTCYCSVELGLSERQRLDYRCDSV